MWDQSKETRCVAPTQRSYLCNIQGICVCVCVFFEPYVSLWTALDLDASSTASWCETNAISQQESIHLQRHILAQLVAAVMCFRKRRSLGLTWRAQAWVAHPLHNLCDTETSICHILCFPQVFHTAGVSRYTFENGDVTPEVHKSRERASLSQFWESLFAILLRSFEHNFKRKSITLGEVEGHQNCEQTFCEQTGFPGNRKCRK